MFIDEHNGYIIDYGEVYLGSRRKIRLHFILFIGSIPYYRIGLFRLTNVAKSTKKVGRSFPRSDNGNPSVTPSGVKKGFPSSLKLLSISYLFPTAIHKPLGKVVTPDGCQQNRWKKRLFPTL